MAPRSLRSKKAERRHHHNQNRLQRGGNQLKIPGLLDAQVIQARHQPCNKDGEELRPFHGKRHARNRIREVRECWKELECARQPHGNSRDRARLGHREPCPHIKEARRVAVSAAQVDVFAARIRHHGAQFRIRHGSEERQQSARDPRQVHQRRGAGIAHHLAWDQKNPAADYRPDHDRDSFARAEDARQAERRTSLRCVQRFLHV